MDAKITLLGEEFVRGMRQKSNIAAVKDAQTKLAKEDCVEGTGHIAIRKMNPLHLDQNTRRLLQLIPDQSAFF
eukprot:scaffold3028_cov109-Skeletonema_marinoi.AAC.4